MNATKLTPLEVLHRQKARLQTQSDALMEALEDHLEYLQHNMGTIIGNMAIDAVLSKTPPIVQTFFGRGENPGTSACNGMALMEGALDIIPFFIKEPKRWLVRLVLEQVKKWIFKRT
ncbi:MAG: hypothetical protein LBS46_07260 [Dysgonamonadaceae bacterium]|jgi:hypothetical protein|nr:hypothetical protein [Dysgonamonadaceae bacterium]